MFSPYLLLVNLELMVVNCLAPRHKGICGKLTGIQFGQLFPGIDIYLASYLIEAIAIAVVANVFPFGVRSCCFWRVSCRWLYGLRSGRRKKKGVNFRISALFISLITP